MSAGWRALLFDGVLVLAVAGCGVPPAPGAGGPTTFATAAGASPRSPGAAATPPAHDGRCTQPELAAEEVLARLFLFVGQRDQRGIADCFARAYLAATPDAVARWAAGGPVRRFAFTRSRSSADVALFEVTAELVGGVGDWKGLATRRVTLGRDPDRWAVLSID